jgi:protein phosphatase
MGTTLEVVVVVAGEAFVAHVGDCRTYLVRDGRARRLTEDHTVAHALCTAGRISDDDESRSPMRSVLTNMIGCSVDVVVDHVHVALRAGDRLLMCSDGLYDHLRTPELGACASTAPGPEPAVTELVTRARARGGEDNITGIVIEVRRE